MARSAPREGREANVRHKSLGVLITASFLTLGACNNEPAAPTVAPLGSPAVDEVPTETLPGLIPGESPAAGEDGLEEEPLESPPAEDAG
jgi:hypothetical protein